MNKVLKIVCLASLFCSMQLNAFTYQGELSQTGNLYSGDVDLKFSLFDAATGGTMLNGIVDTRTMVTITNGRFIVELDQWMGLFTGTDYWLEISVAIPTGSGNFTLLTPRQKLGPVPYSEYSYDVDTTGIQLRITGTCPEDKVIGSINADGSVNCTIDDNTTYSGSDFATSNQACASGQTVTGVDNAGNVTCANLVPEPPNCDQENQGLQYNSVNGWSCVDLSSIGASAGEAQGYESNDSWGGTFDGTERLAKNWADANQSCIDAGGRLPTISELYRVSSAFKGEVGSSYTTNYLWTRTWWNQTQKAMIRLSDAAILSFPLTSLTAYRCIWPSNTPSYFTGSQCMGEPGDECWDHVAYPAGKMVIDKMERPAVSYVAATDECSFVNAHLAHQQDFAENVPNGLPNGTNNWLWTSDHSRYDITNIVRWIGVNTGYNDYTGNTNNWAVRAGGPYRFRCVGVNYNAGAYPSTVANEFVSSSTNIKINDITSSNALYGDSIDDCFNQGGHLAHSRDIMELARSGMTSGTGNYIWLSDRSRYDFTQIARWNTTELNYTGYYSQYGSWGSIDNATMYEHRCVYYPIDSSYTPPLATACASGVACQTYNNGDSKLAIDSQDRPAANYIDATQVCLDNGARMSTSLQLTEAIRAGLPNGTDAWIWTSDSAEIDKAIIMKWSGVDTIFSPIYPNGTTWSLKSDVRNYRCVWDNELW